MTRANSAAIFALSMLQKQTTAVTFLDGLVVRSVPLSISEFAQH